ncbi:tRNA lysidine(34) synthetase TilS [Salinactinospora qingdaonensis]|uniref:tRNA(Ile)-lysidine synthase n=1 Tax=Salinactinospora qingdaonensis TaxID=702744 RepID=A0ABP7G5K2_9ACTN
MGGPPAALASVRSAVRRALTQPPVVRAGALVLVACSGGPDSLALAGATAFVAPRLGLRAGGVTVDHALQEGSDRQAAQTAATLRALGLEPVETVAVRVTAGGGPEGAARKARYAALERVAAQHGAAAVLLGHTLDDQAETVLLRLARGSGARSLAGMAPRSGHYLRPLLGLDRSTVHAAAAAMELQPWHDPHNTDPVYARSRVRDEALPTLECTLGPGIAAALARTARLLHDDADALDAWADRAEQEAAVSGGLSTAVLAELPRAVRTRVLRRAALGAGCPAGALRASHVDELERLVTAWRGQTHVDLPGGLRGRRSGELITFSV